MEAAMGDTQGKVTAAVTIQVPPNVGWAIQSGDKSWRGNDLAELITHMGDAEVGLPTILSLSLIFDLTGDGGALRSDGG
jgi:hypothetical protein